MRRTPEHSRHADLLTGRIVGVHGRHFDVRMADGDVRHCFPRGKRHGPAVGDIVHVRPQGEHEGVIETIAPRRNLLYRSDDMRSKQFAANVDQVLYVVATDPPFSDELLGRAQVAAVSAGIEFTVLLNKADLEAGLPAARARLRDCLAPDTAIVTLQALAQDDARRILMPLLAGRTNLLLGQSGMGKSSILNALIPDARAHTQAHSVALSAGRHTTTATRSYALPGDAGGDLIDSPGFQQFGLAHLEPEDIVRGFPEFHDPIAHCRFYNCTHQHEPGCGVLAAVAQGSVVAARHGLYLRLLDDLAPDRRTPGSNGPRGPRTSY